MRRDHTAGETEKCGGGGGLGVSTLNHSVPKEQSKGEASQRDVKPRGLQFSTFHFYNAPGKKMPRKNSEKYLFRTRA